MGYVTWRDRERKLNGHPRASLAPRVVLVTRWLFVKVGVVLRGA